MADNAPVTPQQVDDIMTLIDKVRQREMEYDPLSESAEQELKIQLCQILGVNQPNDCKFKAGQVVRMAIDDTNWASVVIGTPCDNHILRRACGENAYLVQSVRIKDGKFSPMRPGGLSILGQEGFEGRYALVDPQPTFAERL